MPKHKNYTKFIILCSPRTGSTLLHTYLNSHPNIYSYGEILRREPKSRLHLGTSIFKLFGTNIKAVGLKIFYEYANHEEFVNAYEQIAFDSSIRVIHIVRENLKDQYLSYVNSLETNHWNSSEGRQFTYNNEVDPSKFNAFIKKLDSERSTCLKHLENHKSMVISYEQLISEKDNTLNEIQKFLNVEAKHLSTLLVKIRKS